MFAILETLNRNFQNILGQNLTGLYLHGSLCLGGFQWETSDIDLLAVVNEVPDLHIKTALIEMLLCYRDQYPAKGVEFSLLLLQDCQNFSFPTPYLLHFSPVYYQEAQKNPEQFAAKMHGSDADLACHMTIVLNKGICLYGKPITEVFQPVPKKYYLQSIASDLSDAKENIGNHPVYFLLNFARTDAYLTDNLILSKEDGGRWAIEKTRPHAALMAKALDQLHGRTVTFTLQELQCCADDYLAYFQTIF